jgi:quinol monooxygenase YgiN
MEVVVIATFRARSGQEEVLQQAFERAIPPTHQEEGCIRYALHRDLEDRRRFAMLERWSSREALERHLSSPHIEELFSIFEQTLEEPPSLMVLESIAAGTSEQGEI